MSLFRNNKIAVQDTQTTGKSREWRGAYFHRGKEEAGRGCYGLSLTECGGFPLAGLLLDPEKFFLPPA